ncbi:MAG: hypothetical protein KDD42_04435, partial [Bdellovibrionales bacterium]|nr:hypothetical protein [Bdellovibrionales bacterium]
ACGYCHGSKPLPNQPLSGGRLKYDRYGEIAVPNITPSNSGVGAWTVSELVAAMREGIAPGERELSPDLHRGLEWLFDSDLFAILGYLSTLAPVENVVPVREVSTVDRNISGFFVGDRSVTGYVPAVSPRHQREYGRYLTDHVARCTSCHNTPATLLTAEGYLKGGAVVKNERGEKIAPDISSSETFGIGEWSEAQIINYLRSGRTPEGRRVSTSFCPTNFYSRASDQDLKALAVFLKSNTERP